MYDTNIPTSDSRGISPLRPAQRRRVIVPAAIVMLATLLLSILGLINLHRAVNDIAFTTTPVNEVSLTSEGVIKDKQIEDPFLIASTDSGQLVAIKASEGTLVPVGDTFVAYQDPQDNTTDSNLLAGNYQLTAPRNAIATPAPMSTVLLTVASSVVISFLLAACYAALLFAIKSKNTPPFSEVKGRESREGVSRALRMLSPRLRPTIFFLMIEFILISIIMAIIFKGALLQEMSEAQQLAIAGAVAFHIVGVVVIGSLESVSAAGYNVYAKNIFGDIGNICALALKPGSNFTRKKVTRYMRKQNAHLSTAKLLAPSFDGSLFELATASRELGPDA